MKTNAWKFILRGIVIAIALVFIIKFGGAAILRMYIITGTGDCRKIPILCMVPEKTMIEVTVDEDYAGNLFNHKFPKIEFRAPRGFSVVNEMIKKPFRKKKSPHSGPVIYALREPQMFFIKLFPQVKFSGINDNYEFIKRIAFAQENTIESVTDAFFVVMKTIFTPDLGNQLDVKMIQFSMPGKRGFIDYNLTPKMNYYSCDMVDDSGAYYKFFIKDVGAKLQLEQVFAIISTAKQAQ